MNESRLSRFRKWFANTFVFFGPGLLLAITAAGEAGITEAIEIGAHYGLALLWVVIITLLFKYAFTNGIARYTLATGHTIFDALNKLPGPKNWGPILVIVSYCLEMFAIGAMVLFAATFLDYLIPGVFSIFLLSITILVAALSLLRTHIFHKFEKIMAVIVLVMGVSMIIVLSTFPFNFEMITSGLIPNIPKGSETAILAILGVVGSGLNLMLYSVWLKEKSDKAEVEGGGCYVKNEAFFKRFVKSVNLDIALGFAIVALVTFGFMCLGYAGFAVSFMPHGAELNLDILITQVLYLFSSIPYGTYFFLLFVAIIFFGSVVIGIDARAKALTRVVVSMRSDAGKEKNQKQQDLSVIYLALCCNHFPVDFNRRTDGNHQNQCSYLCTSLWCVWIYSDLFKHTPSGLCTCKQTLDAGDWNRKRTFCLCGSSDRGFIPGVRTSAL